jgi:TRAP-type C4-dicarboxylate transport system substrate-binding protein
MNRLLFPCLLCSLFIVSGVQAAQTIKLGVVTKPGSAQNIVAEKFKELVEERAAGELSVKIFIRVHWATKPRFSSRSRWAPSNWA